MMVRLRRVPRSMASLTLALILLAPSGCGGDGGGTEPDDAPAGDEVEIEPITQGAWYRPDVSTTWQWQLQGVLNTGYDVELYDVDLFETSPAAISSLQQSGRRVICYFSAGTFEPFRPDANRFRSSELGAPLEDFPEERWLDIRSENVLEIMRNRMDMALSSGCDGVEPDNVDGFANSSGFGLTANDQLRFNALIANEAHARGLAVGLKNDLDQVGALLAFFDFSVNEECHEFEECALLDPFIAAGKPVFNAEYSQDFVEDMGEREGMCAAARARGLRTLILPIDLDDSFRISCDV